MNQEHEPSPDFTRFLEWQTRTELRRKERFVAPRRSGRLGRVARIAAIVTVSVLSGAGIVVASQSAQESRAFEVLVKRNQILLELSERRVEAAAKANERERLMIEAGVAPVSQAFDGIVRLAELEQTRDHLLLDRVELMETRRPVNRTLTAPLVGPRDFATEHLRIDRIFLEASLGTLEAEKRRAEALFQSGMADAAELLEATEAAGLGRADLAAIDARIALRHEFLTGNVSAADCETRELILDAERRQTRLRLQVGQLEKRLARARALEQAGRGFGVVARLEPELDTAKIELELVELELEFLK